ncbi:pseudaminic acid cytidylyltransferase [Ningiella sp. W23]|uniref:pseudaminic acid cytidylyltransferase n=1 Tax=Ningiella sp. W23 TaxID=3023715 RepID=UPI0037584BD3
MKFALIPARGGSKRIPNKNIKVFNGKPIIAYSIETAINSGLFDEVIVSTDSKVIADISKQYGASVPFMRPADISDDHASTMDVILHAIEYMQLHYQSVTHCCCIYATAPFLTSDVVKQAYDTLNLAQTQHDDSTDAPKPCFAFTVCEYLFPVQRALTYQQGKLAPMYPEHRNTRSQDLVPAYHDAGQFYWGTIEGFKSQKPVFSEYSLPIIQPHYLVQDIDTLDDWRRAELMHQGLKKS